MSVGYEKNRGSRQSKTSNDVAVQANAHDIVSQTAAFDLEMQNIKTEEKEKHKSKKMKTNENKKYKKYCDMNGSFDKIKKSKEKYRKYGSSEEMVILNDSNRKY